MQAVSVPVMSIDHSPSDCESTPLVSPQDPTNGGGVLPDEKIPSESGSLVCAEVPSV